MGKSGTTSSSRDPKNEGLPKGKALTETSAWFAGPKGENEDWFSGCVGKILADYYAWRRNYFPEDGLVIDAESRRMGEGFRDRFDDRLFELLARLKADFPFQSPRYAAHMVSEQTLPAIAGYFAAMLYNPNNVTTEAAPVTVRLELESAQMIARMVGYGDDSWAHLSSGGTIANLEALWMARAVKYLPLVIEDVRRLLGLPASTVRFGSSPMDSLEALAQLFREAPSKDVIRAYLESDSNVTERGIAAIIRRVGAEPILLAPETQHYSIKKALDVLGLGRDALRIVRVTDRFQMDMDDLQEKLHAVEVSGNHVLAVVTVVGTTEEGAVDPVNRIVQLRDSRTDKFWLHADAAYGGYLRTVTIPDRSGLGEAKTVVQIAGETQEVPIVLPDSHNCDALEAMRECDSVTIDPHKLGYVPYPAGAVCFRSDIVKALARQDAAYIEDSVGDVEAERHSENVGLYILEGSKPGAAAAAVWLSHSLIPLDNTGHGLLIREGIRNACELNTLLESYPDLVKSSLVQAIPIAPPDSNILCFAFRTSESMSLSELNSLNRAIYDRFTVSDKSGKRVYDQPFFLSRTSLRVKQYSPATVRPFLERLGVSEAEYETEGVFLLRSVLMNPWYSEAKRKGRYFISELVEALYLAAEEIVKDGK